MLGRGYRSRDGGWTRGGEGGDSGGAGDRQSNSQPHVNDCRYTVRSLVHHFTSLQTGPSS